MRLRNATSYLKKRGYKVQKFVGGYICRHPGLPGGISFSVSPSGRCIEVDYVDPSDQVIACPDIETAVQKHKPVSASL